MAARTPIVASDLPGYRRVVRHGGEGLLVTPGDVDALGGALRAVLTDSAVRTRLADACAERAETFSMDLLARRYLELYEQASISRASPAMRADRRWARWWSPEGPPSGVGGRGPDIP